MSVDQSRLDQARQDRFVNSDRADLEAFASVLGIDYHPNIGDEKLRARMLESLGERVEDAPPEISLPEPEAAGRLSKDQLEFLLGLNLTSNCGKWPGRRRIVSIVRPDEYKGLRPHPFRWHNMTVFVPWNTPSSVPWPIYQIIKNSNHVEVIENDYVREGKKSRSTWDTRMVNRWNFTDLGDDPATAHLPLDQKEQFRIIAEDQDLFRGYSKRKMTVVARRLKLRYPRGAEAEEIREIVLRSLGYDVDMMEELAA